MRFLIWEIRRLPKPPRQHEWVRTPWRRPKDKDYYIQGDEVWMGEKCSVCGLWWKDAPKFCGRIAQ